MARDDDYEDEGWRQIDDVDCVRSPDNDGYLDVFAAAQRRGLEEYCAKMAVREIDADHYCQTCKGEGELTDDVGGFMALYTCPVCHGHTVSLKEMAQRERDEKEAA